MFGEIMPTLDDMLHDASRYMNTLQIQSPKVRNHYNLNILCTSNIDLISNFKFDCIYFLIRKPYCYSKWLLKSIIDYNMIVEYQCYHL